MKNLIAVFLLCPLGSIAFASPEPILETVLRDLLLENTKNGAVLSIPAHIAKSSYHPFNDGQSNAKMTLGDWPFKGLPVIGFQTQTSDGKISRNYLFHPSLKVTKFEEINLGSNWYEVRPDGWNDSFYFSYETGILPIKQFLEGIPESLRTFSENRTAPNPAKIEKSANSLEKIGKSKLGPGYNPQPWYVDNVHGFFPNEQGAATAVGSVFTWGITDKTYGPFKHLYTCFEARDMTRETGTGAPTGAGWHQIGDPAESILNSIESIPLPVAVARTHGKNRAAFGLTESITATWLPADSVFVTRKDEFHWYANSYRAPVCTEIWVHNCKPDLNNNWGFNCK
jgi:hypothetical protein